MNEVNLGVFGQIHPILANQLNLSPEIYLFEFNIEIINSQLQTNPLSLYKSYSLYPRIIKDLSFIVQRDISFKEIKEAIHINGTEFLSEINLLDEYRGQPIPENQTSLCLQLIFQSDKKTLENKEIENIIKKLQKILTQKFQATLRD
jgi:phenylalanyl-tRNA synthetase beta chain